MEVAVEHYNRVHKEIYEDAIAGYIESQQKEELWDKIQALSQQVFWKEQQKVSDGISLSDLKEVMKEYTIS